MRAGAHADFLDDILGVGAVARETVGRSEQGREVRREQVAELGMRRHFRVALHDTYHARAAVR
jgi:hypothetical protein